MSKEYYGDPPEEKRTDPIVEKYKNKAERNHKSATRLLKYYLSLGIDDNISSDMNSEMDDIVWHIVESAKNEALAAITQKLMDGEV